MKALHQKVGPPRSKELLLLPRQKELQRQKEPQLRDRQPLLLPKEQPLQKEQLPLKEPPRKGLPLKELLLKELLLKEPLLLAKRPQRPQVMILSSWQPFNQGTN